MSYEEYKKDRHKIMGYLTFTWLSLFLVVFFQALAYLFMKFYLFMIEGNSASNFYKKIGGKNECAFNKQVNIDGTEYTEEIFIFEG